MGPPPAAADVDEVVKSQPDRQHWWANYQPRTAEEKSGVPLFRVAPCYPRKSYIFLLAGIVAGFLNLSSLYGFLFYFGVFMLCGLYFSTIIQGHDFPKAMGNMAYGGIADDLSPYLMTWVVTYNLIYVC